VRGEIAFSVESKKANESWTNRNVPNRITVNVAGGEKGAFLI
jgi:hypothetical protein